MDLFDKGRFPHEKGRDLFEKGMFPHGKGMYSSEMEQNRILRACGERRGSVQRTSGKRRERLGSIWVYHCRSLRPQDIYDML